MSRIAGGTVPANTNGKSGAAGLLIGSERATCPSYHIVGSLTPTLLAVRH
jgi:hypothetical protein